MLDNPEIVFIHAILPCSVKVLASGDYTSLGESASIHTVPAAEHDATAAAPAGRKEMSMRLRAGVRSVYTLLQQVVLLAGVVGVLSTGRLHAQAIQYVYNDVGRLVKVIDQNSNVAEYLYDAVGNILEIRRSTLAGLAILSFTPSQGPVGTRVTISGQGFSTNTIGQCRAVQRRGGHGHRRHRHQLGSD